jgi:hypothetical protein
MHAILRRILPALLISLLAAHGTTVTTTTDEDNGSLGSGTGISLREAVKYSTAGETITFAPGLSGQTIRLTFGQITINQSLTIDGSALPAGLTLSADRTGNGKTSDDTYAILLTGGHLMLDSLTLTGANCGESSGCITIQRSSNFTLTLDHCTLTRNAGYHASALYQSGSPALSTSAITIRNSTFSGNSVVKGAAVLGVSNCNLTIHNSTFSQNSAAAISYSTNSSLTTLSISNSTISSNTAKSRTGGLDLGYSNSPFTIYLNNTICADNKPANIYNPSPNGTISGNNNLASGTPLIAPLGDYGGPTQTMPPLPGSLAIDAGTTTTLTTDQRGFSRVSTPDIGAAEYQGSADLTRFWKLDFDGDGSPYGTEQALGTDSVVADSANSRHLTAPAFNASGHAVLSFGIAPAAPGTRWILRRSTDLLTFSEIYRYDGTTDTAAPGITFVRTATGVTVTDENSSAGGAFYRFEASLP